MSQMIESIPSSRTTRSELARSTVSGKAVWMKSTASCSAGPKSGRVVPPLGRLGSAGHGGAAGGLGVATRGGACIAPQLEEGGGGAPDPPKAALVSMDQRARWERKTHHRALSPCVMRSRRDGATASTAVKLPVGSLDNLPVATGCVFAEFEAEGVSRLTRRLHGCRQVASLWPWLRSAPPRAGVPPSRVLRMRLLSGRPGGALELPAKLEGEISGRVAPKQEAGLCDGWGLAIELCRGTPAKQPGQPETDLRLGVLVEQTQQGEPHPRRANVSP